MDNKMCPENELKENNPCELPPTVQEVLIFDVVSPDYIIVASVVDRDKKLDKISNELWNVAPKYSKNTEGLVEIGAYAVIQANSLENISGWWCRGVVRKYDETTSLYEIALLDYGTIISRARKEFMIVPEESLEEPFLAYPIRLYHMVPGVVHNYVTAEKKKDCKFIVKEKWSDEAVETTKMTLKASPKVFFDQMSISGDVREGELYVILENDYYPLRDLLFIAGVGVFLEDPHYREYLQFDFNNRPNDANPIPRAPILRPLYPNGSRPVQKKNIQEEEEEIEDEDEMFYQPMQVEKEYYEGIFIKTEKKVTQLEHMNEAPFVETIHKSLKEMEVKHLWKIQSYTWPAVNQCLDVLIVAAKNSGKTLGYVAPIANLVIGKNKNKDTPRNPTVLVLCSSSNAVHNVHDMFDKVLGRNMEILVVSGFNGMSHRSFSAKLCNGCHILVSTPAWLRRYLSIPPHQKALNIGNLDHIVFDGLDQILKKQNTDLLHLLRDNVITRGKGFNVEGKILQFIAVSEQWSTTIGKFAEQFRYPYLCIRSYPDAVISCGIRPTVRQIKISDKPKAIVDLLGERYHSIKTMIVCCSRKEARKIVKTVGEQLKYIYVDGKSILDDIHDVKSTWNLTTSGNYPVLICTDSVLADLQISDVQWLINYSIATTTKSVFFFRFSSMISSLKEKQKTNAVTIFLDETNSQQLQGVLDLVERSGIKLSKQHVEMAEQIRMRLDREKEGYEICNLIKAFGVCNKKTSCQYRHWALPDVDKPTIPVEIGDTIKMTLVYLHTATHFSGRITEKIDKDGNRHKFPEKDHLMIVSKVNAFFSHSMYKVAEKNAVVGGIYGYRSSSQNYQRIKVMNVSKADLHGRPFIVDVKCIDTGLVYKDVRASSLFKLPDQFRDAPSAIVEIFVADVKPYDDDEEWNIFTTHFVKEWMEKHRSPQKYFEGKVELVLGNSVWIDSLDIKIKINDSRTIEHCSSLSTHLTKNFHGTTNKEHMKRLLTLCQIGQVPNP